MSIIERTAQHLTVWRNENARHMLPLLGLVVFLITVIAGRVIPVQFYSIVGVTMFLALGILQTEVFLLLVYCSRPIIDQFVDYSFLNLGLLRLNIGTIVGGCVFVAVVFYFLVRKRALLKYGFVLPATLFLFLNAIGVVLSDNLLVAAIDWFRICSWIVMLVWVVTVFETEKKIERLINACIFAAAISVIVILVQNVTGAAHYQYGQQVAQRFGWFGGANSAGFVLLGAFPFVLFRAFRVKGIKRMLYVGFIMTIAMAVFFTYFRTNWVVFILQIILVLLFKRKQVKTTFSILVLVLPAIVFVISTNRYAIETRIDDFYYLEEENPTVYRRVGSGRFGIWTDNINAFARAPIFTKMIGRGMGGSASITGGFDGHNDFIDILSNNGLIGLFVYLWFLFTFFKTGRLLNKTASSAFHRDIAFLFWIVFISWLARAVFTGTVFNPNGMWYIAAAFGITCVASRIQDGEQRQLLKDKE